MKKHTTPNEAILLVCQWLHQKKYITAYGGNVSVRCNNRIIITPTRYALSEITADDLVMLDLQGNKLFGENPPSSELGLHLEIYNRRPDVNGIVHTHPSAFTAFAYENRELKMITPESRMYIGKVPIVPYYPIGSENLAKAAGEVISDSNVLMLAKHGLLAAGKDIFDAYNLTELAEQTALTNLYATIISSKS